MDATRSIPGPTADTLATTASGRPRGLVRATLRQPFTAVTWRRAAYAVLSLPAGLASAADALRGAPAGQWQRSLTRHLLGEELPLGSRRSGFAHALLATPLNLLCAALTLYGWSLIPMNLAWPLRAGSDPAAAWGGPTFAGAWAFHAVLGTLLPLLVMPWLGRALTALQLRTARALLS